MGHGHGFRVFKVAGMVVAGLAFAVLVAFIFGAAVMWLWNYLMPGLFGLGELGYWQAFAMVVLARLLFGCIGGHGRRFHGRGCGRHPHGWRGWRHAHYREFDHEAWRHYGEFWREEGRKAFEDYVARKREAAKKE